jgi:hypothetical protein
VHCGTHNHMAGKNNHQMYWMPGWEKVRVAMLYISSWLLGSGPYVL